MTSFFLKYFSLFTLASILFYGCVKKSSYPKIPEINYYSFLPFEGDSADFQIQFTDGDGDIGVADSDSTKTLFITYYYKDTITNKYRAYYSTLFNDTLRTAYVVRKPANSYKDQPISGEISVRLQQYRHSKKIKKIKYVAYLLDASNNKSNVITSPELSVP